MEAVVAVVAGAMENGAFCRLVSNFSATSFKESLPLPEDTVVTPFCTAKLLEPLRSAFAFFLTCLLALMEVEVAVSVADPDAVSTSTM